MSDEQEHGEQCQRCGEIGEDRRTLWHACFYAMDELKIPFKHETLFHVDLATCTSAKKPFELDLPAIPGMSKQSICLDPGTLKTTGELTPHGFFTLRVCKDCRASWMDMIAKWFRGYRHSTESIGTGVRPT